MLPLHSREKDADVLVVEGVRIEQLLWKARPHSRYFHDGLLLIRVNIEDLLLHVSHDANELCFLGEHLVF